MSGVLEQMLLLVGYLTQNAFPKPLSEERENEYIQKMLSGDEDAKNELIRHNLRLVAHIVKKFDAQNDENDDLISIGTIGLIKGINTFKADKGVKLATYIARCAENEILMYLRAQKKKKCEVSINEPVGIDREGNELTLQDVLGTETDDVADKVENDYERKCLLEKLVCLTEREKLIVVLRFGLNNQKPLTQREVGKYLGISRSYVSRIEKKAVEKLRVSLEKEYENSREI